MKMNMQLNMKCPHIYRFQFRKHYWHKWEACRCHVYESLRVIPFVENSYNRNDIDASLSI